MMEEEVVERSGVERGWRQLRALLNLHQILKEMTFKAGRGAKLTFMEIGGRALFEKLMDLWREGMDDLLGLLSAIGSGEADIANLTSISLPDHAQPSQSSPRSVHSIRYRAEVAKWSLKIMAALVVYGFEDWSEEPMAVTFYEILLDRFPYCLDAAFHLPPDTPLLFYIHSFNKVFAKLLVTSQQDDSRAFLSIAQPALNFALAQIQSANHTDDVAVKCMKLVTYVILGMGRLEDYKDNPNAIAVLGPVFDAQVIESLTHTLIHTYFTFTYQELEEWSDSPESSHHTQTNYADADDWSRSRAESLFLALLDLFPDIVIPIAIDHIQSSIQVLDAAIQWLHEEFLLGRASNGAPVTFIDVLPSDESPSYPDPTIPPHILESASPQVRSILTSSPTPRKVFFDPAAYPNSPLAVYFSLDNILLRDASLHTLCAANYQFFRHINFSDLYVNALQKEMYLLSQVVLPPLHSAYSANGGIRSTSYDHNSGNHSSSSANVSGNGSAGIIPSAFDYRKSIIKRRVCLLIGKCVTDIPDELRPTIYHLVESVAREGRDAPPDDGDETFTEGINGMIEAAPGTALATTLENGSNILNNGTMLASHLVPSDPCVALVSVWALECLVNEMSFETTFESFEPLIDTFVASIFGWLVRCKMAESQLKILASIGILVEGIAGHVRPYSFRILDLLVQLWDASGDELLMQSAIIRTIGKLVVAFTAHPEDEDGEGLHLGGGAATTANGKAPSESYESFYSRLIPIIDYSTKVNGRSSDNGLLEEGILLWLCTLRSATHFSQSLLDLFSNLPSIINGGMTEVILQMCIKLVESYVLLGQVDFLHAHVDDLAFIFSSWIGDTKDDLTHDVVRPLEMMLMLYPSEMPVHLEGFLIKVLQLIASGSETDIALCYYVHFFNRVLLHNPVFFLGFLEKCAEPMEIPDLLTRFLSDFTIERIDQLGDLRRRKLAAMALANLLPSPLAVGYPDLVALAIQTSLGVVCDEEAGAGPEYLVRPDETNLADEIYVPELKSHSVQAKQLEHLYASDPVNIYSGRAYVQQCVAQAQAIHPEAVNNILSLIEPRVLETLYQEPSGSSESGDTDTESED